MEWTEHVVLEWFQIYQYRLMLWADRVVVQYSIHSGSDSDIMAKELIPIVFSCIVWGPQLSRQQVNFQWDNLSLVVAINKGSSKDTSVMHLLCCLWFFVAYFDITISATHLPGVTNVTADCLSRNNILQAVQATPGLSTRPSPLPTPITQIITLLGPDWTSTQFCQQFQKALLVMQRQIPDY